MRASVAMVTAMVVCLGTSLARAQDGDAPAKAGPISWDNAKMEAYLDSAFPATVIAPAVERTLNRIFLSQEDVVAQAKEAVQTAMSRVASDGRKTLGDMFDAIVQKDRAAAEGYTKTLVALVDAKGGYWDRAVAKFFPDVTSRARPLVRVGVGRGYRCSSELLGKILGVKASTNTAMVAIMRKAMRTDARNEACTAVRKWSENRAIAEVDKIVEDIQKYVKGDKITLDANATKLGDNIKKSIERELVTIVGDYREGMGRIRQAAERLIEDLPVAAAKPDEKKPEEKK